MGAWIETSNGGTATSQSMVAPYVGAWIETKKIDRMIKRAGKSHPTWVRGLKPFIEGSAYNLGVAPYEGAWIETSVISLASRPWLSRTLRGCVD